MIYDIALPNSIHKKHPESWRYIDAISDQCRHLKGSKVLCPVT